jgi:two-component system NarL family sensor kinase
LDEGTTLLFLYAVLIATGLVGLIIFLFLHSVIRQQRRNLALQQQLLLAEMQTLEKERTRMASDLHDDLGPTLSFIKFQVDSVESTSAGDAETLRAASARVDEALNKVRLIAHDLMPNALTRKGLVTALSQLVGELNLTTPLTITFEAPPALPLKQSQAIAIFRVLQEMIQNTLKHARASRMAIRLTLQKMQLHVLCEDDGIGFDEDQQMEAANGLGLGNLRTRVGMLGGQLKVAASGGQGTQYQFTVPLEDDYDTD